MTRRGGKRKSLTQREVNFNRLIDGDSKGKGKVGEPFQSEVSGFSSVGHKPRRRSSQMQTRPRGEFDTYGIGKGSQGR